MKICKQSGRSVTFGPVRLSYVHLTEPYVPEGTDPKDAKYCVSALIPKSDKEAVDAINRAIEAALSDENYRKFGGKRPARWASPLVDGDEKENVGAEYTDVYAINAKSKARVAVVDRNRMPIVDPEAIYSGMWALVSVNFFAYSTGGNRGVGAGLDRKSVV